MSRDNLHRSRSQRISKACFESLEDRRLMSFSTAVPYATSLNPHAIATGDFNQDGKLDLAATFGIDTNSKVSVRLGDGAGGFGAARELSAPAWGGHAGYLFVVDLNSDTNPDLALSDGINGYSTLIGNGDGTFQSPVETIGYGLVYAGHLQPGNAVVGIRTWSGADWETHVQLQWSDGQGGFTPAGQDGQYWGWSSRMAPINLNDDAFLDVVTGEGAVFRGEIWGLSYDWNQTPPLYGGSVATGDFTGDGYADVVIANDSVAVLRSQGDGTLAAPILHSAGSGTSLSAIATADFNADGNLDVVVTDSGQAATTVMLGNGDGTLRFGGTFATGTSPSSVSVGDFNGDGRPDVAVANSGSKNLSVLLNDGNWTNVPPPTTTISMGDTTVTEGDTGTLNATFVVNLAQPSALDVTVEYSTVNMTATELTDYVATFGTLTIPAGQTSGTFTVAIKGDRIAEPTETFAVNLSSPTNASIADAQATGTILDNDPPPPIVIGNVSRAEGNSGTTAFEFTVSLAAPSGYEVRVNYATASGSATNSGGNRDFLGKSDTVVFLPGQVSKSVTVSVYGDTRSESDETFFVNLSQPVNASIADGQAVGTILNDDSGRGKKWIGPATGGDWSTASHWDPSGVPGSESLVSISAATVTLNSSASISELSLDAGAALKLAAGGNRALRTAGVFLAADSVLDLSDNELIIDYTADTPAASIRSLLISGRNGGSWNGYGLTTSSAAAGATGLGYAESGDLFSVFPASLGGQLVDATSIIVRHALLGDANLSSSVDISDLGILATAWQEPSASFSRGDFNYDGNVDISDLGILATNWQDAVPMPSLASVLQLIGSGLRVGGESAIDAPVDSDRGILLVDAGESA